MIEILEKFYNIKNVQYKEYNNGIVFTIDGINYYLVNTFYNEEKINDIYKLSLFLRRRIIRVHEFVFNNKNLLLSDGYVLFKVNVLIDDIAPVRGKKSESTWRNVRITKHERRSRPSPERRGRGVLHT